MTQRGRLIDKGRLRPVEHGGVVEEGDGFRGAARSRKDTEENVQPTSTMTFLLVVVPL